MEKVLRLKIKKIRNELKINCIKFNSNFGTVHKKLDS